MTLVISWLNLESLHDPVIWTIADTKLIDPMGTTLTDEGAKILELPIVCKNISSPQQSIYYRSSFGFAYAGSSLVGLNVHAMLASILSNLGSTRDSLPNYMSIAEKTKVIATKYSQSIRSLSEICLYGYCPMSKQPFIVTIRGAEEPNLHYRICSASLDQDLRCTFLGSITGRDWIINNINQQLEAMTDVSKYWRIPVYALKLLIKSREFPNIGGGVQLSIAGKGRVDQTWVLSNTPTQQDSFSFRNLDFLLK